MSSYARSLSRWWLVDSDRERLHRGAFFGVQHFDGDLPGGGCLGVPLITPVLPVSLRPDGSLTPTTFHL